MRLFVGITLCEEIKHRIRLIQEEYLGNASIRCEPSDKLHLTLLYIGEVEDEVALKQQLSLVRFPQFEIIIKGVNKFKNRQVIYCLNADDSDELNKLARDILHKGQNIFPELKYRFSPHITIARSKRDVPFDFIGEQIKMQVRQFTLFESKGGVYYPLSEYSSVRS